MQNLDMQAFRSAVSVACFCSGLFLVLRLLGLLQAIPNEMTHWWWALPGIMGIAILIRSFRPGPHIVLSGGLMIASVIAFVTIHGLIAEHTWAYIGAGLLMMAGIALAWSNVSVRSTADNSKSAAKLVLFKRGNFAPQSTELEHLKIFLLCGNVKLDLRHVATPGAPRNVLSVDITVFIGRVKIIVLPNTDIVNHKAFVIRLTKQVQVKVYEDEYMREADVVAATLAFFGDVDVEVRTVDDLLIPEANAPGALPEPGDRAPATH